MDKPAKPLERLSITISGLCLVVVKENRLATAADTVQVLIPDAPDHRPRLTFRRSNRTEQSDAPMERFFGPAGENLVSLPLYKTRARFDLKGNASPEFTMSWAPEKKIERPVPDDALDWLIDADDVELRPRNLCGVTCSILLPPGQIRARNMIRVKRTVVWKYPKNGAKRRHAMADDIVIETLCESPMSFLWRHHGGETKWIDFVPPVYEPLELCISNDDVVDRSYGVKPTNPHEHIEDLAKAVGQPPEELDLPVEADEQQTNGWICPQVVLFDAEGEYDSDYGDIRR
ncbi:MAG TPA: hypothetical protein VGG06_07755 [Thermoanaerobaculia bacterium]